MTDIRRHGFESDAQWREYLEEIEEATGRPQVRPVGDDGNMLADLAVLRADAAALRECIEARLRRGRRARWQRVAGAAAFLLLLAVASR
ncbi:hypothetical protein [Shinella zoogloeoides]